jgi:excisionase family DNA binding protein
MTQLTVKEYARVERVTERTVWNWIAKGAITYRRTPGGGVRILNAPSNHAKTDESARNPSA